MSVKLLAVLILAGTCLNGPGQDHHSPRDLPGDERLPHDPEGELELLFTVKEASGNAHAGHLFSATGDISILASAGFLFYKTFISSQDRPSCIFTPSCSEYAMQSIEKKGLFLGWLSAFDRLSRCHGLVNHEHYPFDPEKQRFYDPVD